jgi:hypothetical protein
VASWVARGYQRLNRDTRGGTLRGLHRELDAVLAAGARRVVLDNTYLTRALRRDVLDLCERHGIAARCMWIDTPPREAQHNLVARMLASHGRLLEPDELRKTKDPGILGPGTLNTMVRTLEPPGLDEGFTAVDVIPFVREPRAGRPAALIALDAIADGELARDQALTEARAVAPDGPWLLFGWRPDTGAAGPGIAPGVAESDSTIATIAALAALIPEAELRLCRHPGGPPMCWCRPPLPGLAIVFADVHGVDLTASVVIGRSSAHRALAQAIGARLAMIGPEPDRTT